MLTPMEEGGGGMSSHEVMEWATYFKILNSEQKNAGGGGMSVDMQPQTMAGNGPLG